MKNLFKVYGFLVLAMFAFLGCSESSENNPPSPPLTLEFDTDGDYDLSEYLFPDKNQTNIYEKKVYVNSEGNREYAAIDANRSFYQIKFVVADDVIDEYYGQNLNKTLHRTCTVRDTKVIETIVSLDINLSIARHADIGELVVKNLATISENENEKEMTVECRLNRVLDEKLGYANIIMLSCNTAENYEMVFLDKRGEVKKIGTVETYYAENIGMIEKIEDVCEDTYFSGTLVESECVKTDTVITQITN